MSEPFLGEIRMFAGNFAPKNWAFCYGQLLPISQNTALFSLLGTQYGGDGRTTFALPDLRGRSMVGMGQGPGLSFIEEGEPVGAESVTLTVAQMPNHSHTAQASVSIPAVASSSNVQSAPADTTLLGPLTLAGRSGTMYSTDAPTTNLAPFASNVTVLPAGSSQPLPTRSPYLGVSFIIALMGVFPSRG